MGATGFHSRYQRLQFLIDIDPELDAQLLGEPADQVVFRPDRAFVSDVISRGTVPGDDPQLTERLDLFHQ
ncbi:hypothetical protein MnTg04_01746 [bacterium MnTg04]|nr:hypothetical protein MnTg04_01746 [bacterium MnTg04]